MSAARHRFKANWSHSGLTLRRHGIVPCDAIPLDPMGYVERRDEAAIGQVGFEPAMCPATRVLRDNRISSLCRDYSDNWVTISFVERIFNGIECTLVVDLTNTRQFKLVIRCQRDSCKNDCSLNIDLITHFGNT